MNDCLLSEKLKQKSICRIPSCFICSIFNEFTFNNSSQNMTFSYYIYNIVFVNWSFCDPILIIMFIQRKWIDVQFSKKHKKTFNIKKLLAPRFCVNLGEIIQTVCKAQAGWKTFARTDGVGTNLLAALGPVLLLHEGFVVFTGLTHLASRLNFNVFFPFPLNFPSSIQGRRDVLGKVVQISHFIVSPHSSYSCHNLPCSLYPLSLS